MRHNGSVLLDDIHWCRRAERAEETLACVKIVRVPRNEIRGGEETVRVLMISGRGAIS
jgi:hypothetical protein